MNEEFSIARMATVLFKNYGAAHLLELEFGTLRIRLRTNEPRLIQKLRKYFSEFSTPTPETAPWMEVLAIQTQTQDLDLHIFFQVKPPDPGKSKIKEEYADVPDGRLVRKRLTGMLFGFGHGRNVAFGDCLANDNQIINFINNRYMEFLLNNDYILGHAAAVSLDGRGLAIAGVSGAGKSTLALHALSRGLNYVSNDRLLVHKKGTGLEMSGVAKLPRINPGTILNHQKLRGMLTEAEVERFSALPEPELWNLEQKYDVYIEEVFGPNRVEMISPMNGLIILNWNRSDEPLQILPVDPAGAPELIGNFIKSPGLFYEPVQGKKEDLDSHAYSDHLKRISVFEMRGGADFEAAADFCALFVRNSN